MSVRTKGGMYCPACEKPVLAVRAGHAVRNTAGAAATAGLALKSERWRCPDCGGTTYNAKTGPKTMKAAESRELATAKGMVIGVLAAVGVGALASLAAALVTFFVVAVLAIAVLGFKAEAP